MKTYAVHLFYRRASQGVQGEDWINIELPDNYKIEDIKYKLANTYYCCELTIIEVKQVN